MVERKWTKEQEATHTHTLKKADSLFFFFFLLPFKDPSGWLIWPLSRPHVAEVPMEELDLFSLYWTIKVKYRCSTLLIVPTDKGSSDKRVGSNY